MIEVHALDNFISPETRSLIEERYYARINEQARFENLIQNSKFVRSPEMHPGCFSDHGVVHMQDVARQALAVLDNVHGVLIPRRSQSRFNWMQGYAVLLACLHDIGMADLSDFGRTMHPEAAAQAVYSPELEDVIQALWLENRGNVAGALQSLAGGDAQLPPPQIVLRELLALSLCHSKKKVPIAVLNEPQALRTLMVEKVSTDLSYLYTCQRAVEMRDRLLQAVETGAGDDRLDLLRASLEEAEKALAALESGEYERNGMINPDFHRHYPDAKEDAFSWLDPTKPNVQELIVDAIDTVRILRCADALRQRGSVLKTSGNYEIFVDHRSANAIYAFRKGDDRLFLVELPNRIGAGEANIVGSELELSGDLRIAFQRGLFTDKGATEYASKCAALVVSDMKVDILDSFQRPPESNLEPGMKSSANIRLLLEQTDDNPEFVTRVRTQLCAIMPEMAGRILIVPSLALASDVERQLYSTGQPLAWDRERLQQLITQIGESGHPVAEIDVRRAFEHVRVARLTSGQRLIQAGAPAGLVYIPLGPGLRINPLGGYRSFSVKPYMPLGVTGVIRGAARNAAVVALDELQVLMIPKSVYFQEWHRTYSREGFRQLIQNQNESEGWE